MASERLILTIAEFDLLRKVADYSEEPSSEDANSDEFATLVRLELMKIVSGHHVATVRGLRFLSTAEAQSYTVVGLAEGLGGDEVDPIG